MTQKTKPDSSISLVVPFPHDIAMSVFGSKIGKTFVLANVTAHGGGLTQFDFVAQKTLAEKARECSLN